MLEGCTLAMCQGSGSLMKWLLVTEKLILIKYELAQECTEIWATFFK